MTLSRFILGGQPKEIDFDTDNTLIIGTGAAETINFAAGINNVFFTAGAGDRVRFANNLEDYTITATGNQLLFEDTAGNVITLIVGASSGNASTVEFADGEADLHMSFGPQGPQAHLGDAVLLHGEAVDPGDVNLTPLEEHQAELEVSELVVYPAEPNAGEIFSVDVTISENANVETENLTVSLGIAGTGIDETIDIGTLQDGETTLTFDGLSLPDAGDYTVEVTADADNADPIEYTESFKILESEQIFSPTDEEQLMLTLINRARLDPEGEADRYGIDLNEGLSPGEISPEPKQPLAFNPTVTMAARDHSLWMLSEDKFSHTGEGGSSPGDRMEKAGYQFEPPWSWGENLAWQGSSIAPEDYYDFIFLQHEALFLSPGHRENTLRDNFREAGVGSLVGEFDGYDHSLMSTVKFASSGDSVFLTGTVYEDLDHSDTYSPGEGLGDILVEAGGNITTTWDSGGYVLELKPGSYDIVFSGGPLSEPIEREMNIGESNVLLDIILPSDTYEFASNPIQPEMIDVFEAEAVAPEAQDKQDISVMGMTASYEDELIV